MNVRVVCVVGARPNFMKVAPVHAALRAAGCTPWLVHTGQHYDHQMSQVFFEELELPRPDANLGVGSGTHAQQTARVMTLFEPLLLNPRPDWVLVAGDVNSTVAAALVAAKLGIPVAHLEAGLRSFDRSMPEEINRVVTDQLSDLLLTPSRDADANLLREGVSAERIVRVGNAMIDSLQRHLPQARSRPVAERLGLRPREYALVTLHRPGNVDNARVMRAVFEALATLSRELPVVFPVHPRTHAQLSEHGLMPVLEKTSGLRLIEPCGYLDFLALQDKARLVITDSGGLQEETTALGVPCITVRPNTERPVTIDEGTNTLVGQDPERLLGTAREILADRGKRGRVPDLWDGCTAERVAGALLQAQRGRL